MEIVFTKQAIKDFEKVKENPTLLKKVRALLELLENDPYTINRNCELHQRLDEMIYQEYERITIKEVPIFKDSLSDKKRFPKESLILHDLNIFRLMY